MSSLDTGEIRTIDSRSGNVEIMMGSETDDIVDDFLNFFCKDIRKNYKKKWDKVSLFVKMLIYCITIFIKQL